MQKPTLALDESAKSALLNHDWPGNVRELDNAIQRALILQSGAFVTAQDLGISGEHLIDFESTRDRFTLAQDVTFAPTPNVDDAVYDMAKQDTIHVGLKHKEFELILDALRIHNGRKNRAADYLGISSRTLRYKLARMRELGMDVDSAIAEIR